MDTQNAAHPEPDFYSLPFAAQMIVWATRKQLHSIVSNGPFPDEVLSVFHLAEWGGLYESILAVVETLAQADGPRRLVLHAVACPRLAPHEVSLLNALAYVQRAQPAEAALDLCEILRPASARQLLVHLTALSGQLDAQGQRFEVLRVPFATNTPVDPVRPEVVH